MEYILRIYSLFLFENKSSEDVVILISYSSADNMMEKSICCHLHSKCKCNKR